MTAATRGSSSSARATRTRPRWSTSNWSSGLTDPRDLAKAESRESWGRTPYGPLADRLRPAAAELVAAVGIEPGMRVLDVAAGNGNAAVEAARAGAGQVVASDLAPLQVEQGRERTAAEGLDVEWAEADAEELPFDDASFDVALSVFGAMFAPRPERVAAELFRVVRPGGVVAMANWRPEGFQGGFFEIVNKYRPLPEGVQPSALWGVEEHVRERLGPYADEIRVERRPLAWHFESLQEMGEFFANSGPGSRAAELTQEQQHEMGTELFALVNEHNTAEGGAIAFESFYSVIVARKKS